MMPLFVSPEDVILRMQLGAELTGVEDVVSSGIIGAQLHVQRVIDGKLARQSQDCQFFLDSQSFSGIQPDGLYRLEIPSGFIRRDTTVTVTYAEGPFDTFEAIDSLLMKVDYDRGYVLLDKTYGDYYVRVQCDTGFEDGTRYDTQSPPQLIPMEAIPMDVYEAILSLVPITFNATQTTTQSAEAKQQYQTLTDRAAMLLQPYIRTRGFSFRPIWK